MSLDSRPVGEVTIRYEYYAALVRLGIVPRRYPRPDPLRRRESASGFEDQDLARNPKAGGRRQEQSARLGGKTDGSSWP